jgi:hypothetical protein
VETGQLSVGTHGQEIYYLSDMYAMGRKAAPEANGRPWVAPGLKLMAIGQEAGGCRVEVKFSLDRPTRVEMDVFSVTGRVVCHRDAGLCEAGRGTIAWDGGNSRGHRCSPGVYFVRLVAENESVRGKAVLVR